MSETTMTTERVEELAKYAEIRNRPESRHDCFITPSELMQLCATARRAARALEQLEHANCQPWEKVAIAKRVLRGDA